MQWFLLLTALLPLSNADLNNTVLIELINKLADFYKTETLLIFSDFSVSFDANQVDFAKELMASNHLPQMNFNKTPPAESKSVVNDERTLVILQTEYFLNGFQANVDSSLRGMRHSKLVLILRLPSSLKYWKGLRNWLSKKQFTTILIVFENKLTHNLEIFSINRYPSFQWLNRTHLIQDSAGKLFPQPAKDFKSYPIRIPFMEDIPAVFIYKKHNNNRIVGIDACYIQAFAEHMNIDLSTFFMRNMDLNKMLRFMKYYHLELSIHSYSNHFLEGIDQSYPLDMEHYCIIVPFRNQLPKSALVFKAFDGPIWAVIGFCVFYVAHILRLLDPLHTKITTSQYLLQSFAILLYSSNKVLPISSDARTRRMAYGVIFLLGFIINSFYSCFLSRFCTTLVFRTGIETIDDLIREELRIMIIDYETTSIRLRAGFDEKFFKLLYPMPYYDVVLQRNNFNDQFAYMVSLSDWNHLNKQQSLLKKPLFRATKICFGGHFNLFPLQQDSHLKSYLNDFILRIKEAGIDLVWKDLSFQAAVAMKYSRILVDKATVIKPLGLVFFKKLFILWSIGIGVSVIAFGVEILRSRVLGLKSLVSKRT